MDFGVVGLDGFAGSSDIGFASSDQQQQQQEAKNNKRYGSGFQKLDGSGTVDPEDCWRSSKQARSSDDFSAPKTMLQLNTGLMRTSSNHFSADGQNLLSFSSSPKSEAQNATLLPSYFQQAVSAYTRNTGNSNNSGSLNGAFVHWTIAGGKGPFTPSQWMELEHQALIYKYITANVPIPSNLLIPIKKAFDSAGLFSTGLLRSKSSNTLGWGSIHLGYGNSTDPEPGRCRRTDGKKWRCWRDAVPDQKYCERHINRGRHRSRKPVEGQAGQSVAGTAMTINSKKVMQGGGGTSSLGIANQQLKSWQPHAVASNSSAATQTSRMFVNKESVGERMQHTPDMSMLSKESTLLIQKQQLGYEESSRSEFGLVTSDALLNPSQKRASDSVMSCGSFGSSSQNLTEGGGTDSQHPLRHFIEDWPKTSSDRPSVVAWPDHLDMQSDRTQLSISIPKAAASSDFIPSTSSTNNEKFTLSPLRMSRELDSVPMGLGVSSNIEQNTKESSWIPITWEPSLGGPLGEVLHQTHINAAECKKSSVLNLMTEGWDNNSPSSLGSSPTGVLQRTGFGSVSNSSAGSSPRAEIRSTHEGASQCNELLMFPAL